MNPGKFISVLGTFLMGSVLLACGGGGSGPLGGGPPTLSGVGEQMAPSGGSGEITQNTPMDSGFPDPKKAVPSSGFFAHLNQPAKEDACLLPPDTAGNRKARIKFTGYVGTSGVEDVNGFSVRAVQDMTRFQDTAKTHPQNGTQGYFEFTIYVLIPPDTAADSNTTVQNRRLASLVLREGQIGVVEPTATDGDEDGDSGVPFTVPLGPNGQWPSIEKSMHLAFFALANTYETPYLGVETDCDSMLCQSDPSKKYLGGSTYNFDELVTWLKERNPCPSS